MPTSKAMHVLKIQRRNAELAAKIAPYMMDGKAAYAKTENVSLNIAKMAIA